MAGRAFHLNMPHIINVKLHGALTKGVSSKDIILKVLQLLSVKGGVGSVIEYSGDGVASLSIPQRATITNMGSRIRRNNLRFPK